jgi:hypothetical protein
LRGSLHCIALHSCSCVGAGCSFVTKAVATLALG